RNYKRIYLLAMSYLNNHCDSEDIMQSVFMKLLKTDKEFNSEEHIDKWLTITCIHKCKDFFRLRYHKSTVSLDELNEIYTFDSSENVDIFNSIQSLPQKERVVVHLFYYEDLTVNEIAKLIKSNSSTVKTRLQRARKRLRKILGDDWIDEQ
ncbi:MAG: sigma-70 family RNA polymerase sigma factor, partial [Ruminococcus sp.]|nr:sigma-70 family RNA polymerase sigma factor [Candidatus Copronaster equi]